ncbi:MAG: double-strand break repair helicase AddA [Sphingomonadales bacterium 12-68-11]|nr:MAG: double-strand break repair helicase AddA [Sphingomonadales bacterium 12-68-11]
MSGPHTSRLHPLQDNQARAVDPAESVWLSASAGTGKTQVLAARVLRLLLTPGVRPENILCLTFTKAGAAEMAERVNAVLASWVRMKPEALGADLISIGERPTPDLQARARTLFASVLDCAGGGLRIDTIHAFSQWLLAAFPEEAGLLPGSRPMEDRDRELLAHRVLADLLVEWDEHGEKAQIEALEMLSLRMGPDATRGWLMRCAEAREAWFGPGGWQEPLGARVRQLIGLPADAGPALLAGLCADTAFDIASLRRCMEINARWAAKTGQAAAERIGAWVAGDPAARAAAIDDLLDVFFTKAGELRASSSQDKIDPAYRHYVERVAVCIGAVAELKTQLKLVDLLVPALTVGRRFALAWDDAKQREGLADFDDLIRRAAALLGDSGIGQWIRYKLDRQFDHILVDEAQDTNAAQWSIIQALTGDFFTGEGQRTDPLGAKLRTIFVVGDYKQAIFRFQGTSPENFAAAKARYAAAMSEAARNARQMAEELREPEPRARDLLDLGLGRSYRTAQSVLTFVDRAIAAIGHASFGLDREPEAHRGDERPGLVVLWKPVEAGADESEDGDEPQDWISEPERRMADKIAEQIKALIGTHQLVKGVPRKAGPGDVMVLVRKRRELAGLIVARLHAAGVPVAGVDRLRLGAPLAVKDLMAALRFAAQPLDDLSLANLLVSPLIGWSQAQLLEHGYRPDKEHLWSHLRASRHPDVAALRDRLDPLLARADFEPPQALLHWLLVGPWDGWRKLLARLGREAGDPIDELLNAALAFAASHTPSLQGFLHWFDAGEGELKREAGAGRGLVRVMTVHGSKGLQAPIVILADAAGNPDRSPTRGLSLEEPVPGGGGRPIPLPGLGKGERVGRIAEAEAEAAKAEREEHWRLLYVAMTRAEEALFVGGALGKQDKDGPAADSWYARLAPLFPGQPLDDDIWGQRFEWGQRAVPVPDRSERGTAPPIALPDWVLRPIGPEPRPPRPLAPSSAGEDLGADPPLPPDLLAVAARRGVLLHRLLERLPDTATALREAGGRTWLARNAAELTAEDREDMLARALAVIADPRWAALFSPAALAEVPIAALVGDQVVAGTIDRLLIEPDRVLVADFKTARRPPASLEQVPLSTIRQMAAYVAALWRIYPGRTIEAAVLYTQVPRLIALPGALLEGHKPSFATLQESLDR